jgi:DNA-binding HxlR family transcriptional regulator
MHTTNYSDKKSPTGGDDETRIDIELTPLQTRIVRALARDGPCRFKTLVGLTEPAVESALTQALDNLQRKALVQQSTAHKWPRYRLSKDGEIYVRREAQRWVNAAEAVTEDER